MMFVVDIFVGRGAVVIVSVLDFRSEGRWLEVQSLPSRGSSIL